MDYQDQSNKQKVPKADSFKSYNSDFNDLNLKLNNNEEEGENSSEQSQQPPVSTERPNKVSMNKKQSVTFSDNIKQKPSPQLEQKMNQLKYEKLDQKKNMFKAPTNAQNVKNEKDKNGPSPMQQLERNLSSTGMDFSENPKEMNQHLCKNAPTCSKDNLDNLNNRQIAMTKDLVTEFEIICKSQQMEEQKRYQQMKNMDSGFASVASNVSEKTPKAPRPPTASEDGTSRAQASQSSNISFGQLTSQRTIKISAKKLNNQKSPLMDLEQTSFYWLMQKLLAPDDKIENFQLNFVDTGFFDPSKGKVVEVIRSDREGFLQSVKQESKISFDALRRIFAAVVRERRKNDNTGFDMETNSNSGGAAMMSQSATNLAPVNQQQSTVQSPFQQQESAVSPDIVNKSHRPSFVSFINNDNKQAFTSLNESNGGGVDQQQRIDSADAKLLQAASSKDLSNVMTKNASQKQPMKDGSSGSGGLMSADSAKNQDSAKYQDSVLFRYFMDPESGERRPIVAALTERNFFLTMMNMNKRANQDCRCLECIQTCTKTKFGLGKHIPAKIKIDLNLKAEEERKEKYLAGGNVVYPEPVKYDFLEVGREFEAELKQQHREQMRTVTGAELQRQVEERMRKEKPQLYCNRVALKMCYYIQKVYNIEVLKMNLDFYQDDNGKIWFFYAQDIVVRNMKPQGSKISSLVSDPFAADLDDNTYRSSQLTKIEKARKQLKQKAEQKRKKQQDQQILNQQQSILPVQTNDRQYKIAKSEPTERIGDDQMQQKRLDSRPAGKGAMPRKNKFGKVNNVQQQRDQFRQKKGSTTDSYQKSNMLLALNYTANDQQHHQDQSSPNDSTKDVKMCEVFVTGSNQTHLNDEIMQKSDLYEILDQFTKTTSKVQDDKNEMGYALVVRDPQKDAIDEQKEAEDKKKKRIRKFKNAFVNYYNDVRENLQIDAALESEEESIETLQIVKEMRPDLTWDQFQQLIHEQQATNVNQIQDKVERRKFDLQWDKYSDPRNRALTSDQLQKQTRSEQQLAIMHERSRQLEKTVSSYYAMVHQVARIDREPLKALPPPASSEGPQKAKTPAIQQPQLLNSDLLMATNTSNTNKNEDSQAHQQQQTALMQYNDYNDNNARSNPTLPDTNKNIQGKVYNKSLYHLKAMRAKSREKQPATSIGSGIVSSMAFTRPATQDVGRREYLNYSSSHLTNYEITEDTVGIREQINEHKRFLNNNSRQGEGTKINDAYSIQNSVNFQNSQKLPQQQRPQNRSTTSIFQTKQPSGRYNNNQIKDRSRFSSMGHHFQSMQNYRTTQQTPQIHTKSLLQKQNSSRSVRLPATYIRKLYTPGLSGEKPGQNPFYNGQMLDFMCQKTVDDTVTQTNNTTTRFDLSNAAHQSTHQEKTTIKDTKSEPCLAEMSPKITRQGLIVNAPKRETYLPVKLTTGGGNNQQHMQKQIRERLAYLSYMKLKVIKKINDGDVVDDTKLNYLMDQSLFVRQPQKLQVKSKLQKSLIMASATPQAKSTGKMNRITYGVGGIRLDYHRKYLMGDDYIKQQKASQSVSELQQFKRKKEFYGIDNGPNKAIQQNISNAILAKRIQKKVQTISDADRVHMKRASLSMIETNKNHSLITNNMLTYNNNSQLPAAITAAQNINQPEIVDGPYQVNQKQQEPQQTTTFLVDAYEKQD